MSADLDEWRGLLSSRSEGDVTLQVDQPLQRDDKGSSGAFLARASDGQRWWVKPQNNLQHPKVIVTEYVVGSLGLLIGAPTCEVAVIRIPEEIAGWEFRPQAVLQVGLAHASRHVRDAEQLHSLEHRKQDDNSRRHAGVFAIYDWCWGSDDQWLYCHSEEQKLYSHDHGMYLPGGPNWSEETLTAQVAEGHGLNSPRTGLDPSAVNEIAGRLESINKEKLLPILRSVPTVWTVTDAELEALGFFLERRAPAVAERLRQP